MSQPQISPPAPANGAVPTHPFLVWPVARREFYWSIACALGPALLWGIMIFGFRAAAVIVATVLGATIAHKLFQRFTRRGQTLLYAHTLCSALVLAALSRPYWSPLLMLVAGALLTGLLWIFYGPGRDRIHPAVVIALVLGLAIMPLLYETSGPPPDAVLARNRLFMGDIRYSTTQPVVRWPQSSQIGGYDAVAMARPDTVLAQLFPQLQGTITNPEAFSSRVDQALVSDLSSIDLLILGVRPGYIGTVSSLGLLLGGLYLAYRNVLRPRSVTLYLVSVTLGLTLLSFMPVDFSRWTSAAGVGALWRHQLDKMLTLQFYQFFSGDILFAAVIILALPGTEPITPKGRRWMLILAGLATPFIQRTDLSIPVATTILLFLQPLNPIFDTLFPRRSWLN